MDIGQFDVPYLNEYTLTNNSPGLTNSGIFVNRYSDKVNGAKNFAETLENLPEKGPESGASRKAPYIDKTDKLYEQCLELETFLVKTLINSMRNTIQKSGLVDEGYAGKVYEDMLYDEYSRDFTKNAGFGLAEQAYLELTGRRGQAYGQ
ncbi:MAG: rod-binding protein [Treponema sp.]|jgi:flagellar protein FlgJ|nr:rod-binding protein [Treponema sp.]